MHLSRTAYDALWRLAAPLLPILNTRLRDGADERLVPQGWCRAPVDVWIQAASGGEAYLAYELVKELAHLAPRTTTLLTTWTRQGMDVLEQARGWHRAHMPGRAPELAYVPFDAPSFVADALRQARPKVLVLLETELWPGLLLACREAGVPVLVANARMTRKSFSRYSLAASWLRTMAPTRILAMAEPDAHRFATLFGRERVGRMENIKFDRFAPRQTPQAPPLEDLLPKNLSLLVLGSVREEEEEIVSRALPTLRQERPRTALALAPRHLQRVPAWKKRLLDQNIPYRLRSAVTREHPVKGGELVLWDVFGELSALYAHARAAFVGGSLAPLGGQNVLEPMHAGLVPVTGPHWENFQWIGPEVVAQGLLREMGPEEDLAETLLDGLAKPPSKAAVRKHFQTFLAPRLGGTARAARDMLSLAGLNPEEPTR